MHGLPIEKLWRIAWTESLCGYALVSDDPEWAIVDCNETFARLLGYSPLELVGKRIADITHPSEATVSTSTGKRYRRIDMTKRYVRKDGSVVTCHLKSNPVDHGGVSIWFSQINPVTEHDDIEQIRREYDLKFQAFQLALDKTHGDLRSLIGRDIDVTHNTNVSSEATNNNTSSVSSSVLAVVVVLAAVVVLAFMLMFGGHGGSQDQNREHHQRHQQSAPE